MTYHDQRGFDEQQGRELALRAPQALSPIGYASLDDDIQRVASVDVRAFWSALYRNRRLIAATLGLSLAGGVASVLLSTPLYRAEASVEVDPQPAKVLNSEDLEPALPSAEIERFIRTQTDILRSRSLAQRVAITLPPAQRERLTASTGLLGQPKEAAETHMRADEKVIEVLQDGLSVEMLPNSRIVTISFEDKDPTLAARVANGYAEELIRANLQRRVDMSAYSKQFLGGQLAEAKRRLEDAERAAMKYARSAGLIDASAGASHKIETGPKSLTTASLVELNDAYSTARAGRVQAQQRWQQAQATGAMNLPEVLSNPTVQQLSQRRAELQAQYQEETQRRQADHPAVQQLSAKIAEIDRQISGLATNIRTSIRDQFMVAQRQEAALRGNVSQLKSETLSEQDRGIQYNILRREVDTSREMYDGLLQRFKEVSAAAGIASNNVAIVDRAPQPVDPVSPRALLNLLLATLVGLSLSLFAVFFRERFVNKIRDPEDVDRLLKTPVLGVVPLVLKGETPQQALADPRSPHCEAHNSIEASLEFSSTSGVPNTLLVTSSRPAEGKSTTALSLAISFASGGKRVLLIDADLRRPSLHLLLSQDNETGLVHLLTRAKDVHEVVQTTGVPNLSFIGSGPTPPNPAQLLSSETLRTLLSTLSRGYDVVIVDGPPVMGLADAPRLAAAAAGTIFVVEAAGVQERLAGRALQRLRSSHARILGVVLTKYDSKQRGYGTEYDYGYYGYGYDLKQASRDKKRGLRHLMA